MDMIRTPYMARMKVTPGSSRTVPVRWFRAASTALDFPAPHRFASGLYDRVGPNDVAYPVINTGLGEQTSSVHLLPLGGANVRGLLGLNFCGPVEYFQQGQPAGAPPLLVGSDGVPLCCRRLRIGGGSSGLVRQVQRVEGPPVFPTKPPLFTEAQAPHGIRVTPYYVRGKVRQRQKPKLNLPPGVASACCPGSMMPLNWIARFYPSSSSLVQVGSVAMSYMPDLHYWAGSGYVQWNLLPDAIASEVTMRCTFAGGLFPTWRWQHRINSGEFGDTGWVDDTGQPGETITCSPWSLAGFWNYATVSSTFVRIGPAPGEDAPSAWAWLWEALGPLPPGNFDPLKWMT